MHELVSGGLKKLASFLPGKPEEGNGESGALPPPGLLDAMRDGREFSSIMNAEPEDGNLLPDIHRALTDIESVRGRPCICYVGNTIVGVPGAEVNALDELPFAEVVDSVDGNGSVDVFLATCGGSIQTISKFVECLRQRFNSVEFLIADRAMSAGTLFALSGDRVWMDRRSQIGPVDPQIPSRSGRLVPAQSLFVLLDHIKKQIEEAQKKGKPMPAEMLSLLGGMDQHSLGDALSQTQYIATLLKQYIARYKFNSWNVHSSSGKTVTDAEKKERAGEIAEALTDHTRWRSHGYVITRERATALNLKIEPPEADPKLERAMRRLWAVCQYGFQRAHVAKIMGSRELGQVLQGPGIERG